MGQKHRVCPPQPWGWVRRQSCKVASASLVKWHLRFGARRCFQDSTTLGSSCAFIPVRPLRLASKKGRPSGNPKRVSTCKGQSRVASEGRIHLSPNGLRAFLSASEDLRPRPPELDLDDLEEAPVQAGPCQRFFLSGCPVLGGFGRGCLGDVGQRETVDRL